MVHLDAAHPPSDLHNTTFRHDIQSNRCLHRWVASQCFTSSSRVRLHVDHLRSCCSALAPVGSGAVGAFYGSRLHLPDLRPRPVLVSVICRSNYQAVKENGFEMETHSFGNYHFTPHAVFANVQEAASSGINFDYVVVTTKALPDVTDDSELIQSLIKSEKTSIVLIQNGVGVEDPHRRRFPNNPILSAVTIVSAAQVSQGKVVQNRWTRISIGPYMHSAGEDANAQSDAKLESLSMTRTQEFVDLLKVGGVKDAEYYDEAGLQLVRWHKIAVSEEVIVVCISLSRDISLMLSPSLSLSRSPSSGRCRSSERYARGHFGRPVAPSLTQLI